MYIYIYVYIYIGVLGIDQGCGNVLTKKEITEEKDDDLELRRKNKRKEIRRLDKINRSEKRSLHHSQTVVRYICIYIYVYVYIYV
jgi:hypothetical protein